MKYTSLLAKFSPFSAKSLASPACITAASKSCFSTFKTSSLMSCSFQLAARRRYHEKVIDHYENPRNVGSFAKNEQNVGTGLVGAPACGDVMKLQIKVDDSGKIAEAKFKTFGCGSAIASSSLATEWIKGKSLDEALTIKNTHIAKELCLPPVKLHCSMLAEDAIRSAISDYRAKSQKQIKTES